MISHDIRLFEAVGLETVTSQREADFLRLFYEITPKVSMFAGSLFCWDLVVSFLIGNQCSYVPH